MVDKKNITMKKLLLLLSLVFLGTLSTSLNAQSCKAPRDVRFEEFTPDNLLVSWSGQEENQGYLLLFFVNDEFVLESFTEQAHMNISDYQFAEGDNITIQLRSVCADGSLSDELVANFDTFIEVDVVFSAEDCGECDYILCDSGLAYPCECGCPDDASQINPACKPLIAFTWKSCGSSAYAEMNTLNPQMNDVQIVQNSVEQKTLLTINTQTKTSLEIYNQNGQKVKTLLTNQSVKIGEYEYNLSNLDLRNGLYYLVLESQNTRKIVKFVQMK